MDVTTAKQLKYGQRVACPADGTNPAFIGSVHTEGLSNAPVYENAFGDEYIWVEVLRPGRHKSFWPSNRLGTA